MRRRLYQKYKENNYTVYFYQFLNLCGNSGLADLQGALPLWDHELRKADGFPHSSNSYRRKNISVSTAYCPKIHMHTHIKTCMCRSAHPHSLPHAIEHMCKHLLFICISSGTLLTCHQNTFSLPRRGWMQALEESLG